MCTSERFGKIWTGKEMQVYCFLKYLPTVSAIMKMDSPDTLFTMLLGMPQSQKEAYCKQRLMQKNCYCRTCLLETQ